MKKFYFILTALVVISSAKSFAQQTVNLNITLSDVVSLTVSDSELDFVFDSEEKYRDGITTPVANHLEVLSSRNYKIDVKAGTITGSSALPANGVKITPSNGSAGNFDGVSPLAEITLGASNQTLITSSESSFDGSTTKTQFNISYLVGANQAFAGLPTGNDNVIPVEYTITQP